MLWILKHLEENAELKKQVCLWPGCRMFDARSKTDTQKCIKKETASFQSARIIHKAYYPQRRPQRKGRRTTVKGKGELFPVCSKS